MASLFCVNTKFNALIQLINYDTGCCFSVLAWRNLRQVLHFHVNAIADLAGKSGKNAATGPGSAERKVRVH